MVVIWEVEEGMKERRYRETANTYKWEHNQEGESDNCR